MIGANHTITGIHSGAFNNGENVALHALARNVGTVPALAPGDFVDLIQEYNSCVLNPVNRHASDLVHIDEALLFFLNEIFESLIHLHLALLGATAEDVRQHVLDVDIHLFNTLVGHNFKGGEIALADIDLNLAFVELALAQLLAQLFASARRGLSQRSAAVDHNSSGSGRLARARRG